MQFVSRRQILSGAGSLALMTSGASTALGQAADWPNKTVRVIVNFAPGGSTDNAMRPFAESLSRALGQQIVIDNKGGASGAIGIEAAIKSPPDGYNFLATVSLSVVTLPHLRKTPYDPLKDLIPVIQFTDGTLLIAVHPSVPINSIQELAAFAKQNPGKLSWGTAGVGSYGHTWRISSSNTRRSLVSDAGVRRPSKAMASKQRPTSKSRGSSPCQDAHPQWPRS